MLKHVTNAAGVSYPACSTVMAPIHRFSQLGMTLPPSLHWLAASPTQGFNGQWARVNILVESLHLPNEPAWLRSAQSSYSVELRLPGSSTSFTTPIVHPPLDAAQPGDGSHSQCDPTHFLSCCIQCLEFIELSPGIVAVPELDVM